MDRELWLTALHEAGHFVAQYRLSPDSVIASISIEKKGETLGRVTSEDRLTSVDPDGSDYVDPELLRVHAIILCAGYAAVRASGESEETASLGCEGDFDLFEREPLSLDECKQAAVEVLQKPENLNAVRFLAERLVEQQTIDGDLAGLYIDRADGDISDEVIARYLALRQRS